jgi:hypothetical protein
MRSDPLRAQPLDESASLVLRVRARRRGPCLRSVRSSSFSATAVRRRSRPGWLRPTLPARCDSPSEHGPDSRTLPCPAAASLYSRASGSVFETCVSRSSSLPPEPEPSPGAGGSSFGWKLRAEAQAWICVPSTVKRSSLNRSRLLASPTAAANSRSIRLLSLGTRRTTLAAKGHAAASRERSKAAPYASASQQTPTAADPAPGRPAPAPHEEDDPHPSAAPTSEHRRLNHTRSTHLGFVPVSAVEEKCRKGVFFRGLFSPDLSRKQRQMLLRSEFSMRRPGGEKQIPFGNDDKDQATASANAAAKANAKEGADSSGRSHLFPSPPKPYD